MGKFVSVRISPCRITGVSFDQEVPNMLNHQEVKKKTQYKYARKEKPRSSMPGFLLVYFIFILETESHYIAQAGLRLLAVRKPQPLKCGEFSPVPS